jgi:hypothetical protein
MSKVKVNLTNISPNALVAKATHIRQKMNGNVNFPAPTPTLVQLGDAISELSLAIDEALKRNKKKIAIRNVMFRNLKTMLRQLGTYVQHSSMGNDEKIISSGFETKAQGNPTGTLPSAANMRAKPTATIGSIKLNWDRVFGARMYMIEWCNTNPSLEANWKILDFSSHARYTTHDLTTGQICWFRVKAMGVSGVGAASDPARCVVP